MKDNAELWGGQRCEMTLPGTLPRWLASLAWVWHGSPVTRGKVGVENPRLPQHRTEIGRGTQSAAGDPAKGHFPSSPREADSGAAAVCSCCRHRARFGAESPFSREAPASCNAGLLGPHPTVPQGVRDEPARAVCPVCPG